MPYADPAVQKAYLAAYYTSGSERFRAARRKRHTENPDIARKYARKYRQQNPERDRKRKRMSYTRHAEKLRALVRAARGPCVDCGKPSDHLHHVDPATKAFPLGSLSGQSVAAVEAEIAKCIPLCRSCHIQRHKHTTQTED